MPSGCGLHNCNANTSDCTNTIGGFQCTCRFGLATDGVSCARKTVESIIKMSFYVNIKNKIIKAMHWNCVY